MINLDGFLVQIFDWMDIIMSECQNMWQGIYMCRYFVFLKKKRYMQMKFTEGASKIGEKDIHAGCVDV